MADTFIPGEVARLQISVTTMAGLPADPGSITLLIKPPVGAVASYAYGVAAEVVRDGEGQYRADIPVQAAGRWYYKWELGSPNSGAAEGSFNVKPSRFMT